MGNATQFMKKVFSLICFIALVATSTVFAKNGEVISSEKVISLSKEELLSMFKKYKVPEVIISVKNGVDVYEVIYTSTYPNGREVKASGILFVPTGVEGEMPIIIYNHGTQLVKNREIDLQGEQFICAAFAGDGYIMVFPDYFGIGKGEGFHPYQHAESEAQASVDMLRASQNILKDLNIKYSDKLFVTGYSQGGHASMSTTKFIQERCKGEFKVTAAAPMSGAYDMTGVQAEVMFKEYDHPMYLPYILMGYHQVYDLGYHPSELLKAPYDSLVPVLFDGVKDFGEVNKHLPKIPADIFKDEVLHAYLNDSTNALRKLLESNNLYDWKPESPMMLCYCKADEQVTYKNALVAYKVMKKNGAKNLKKTHVGPKFNHEVCAIYSSMYVKFYFDTFRNGSVKGHRGDAWKRFLIDVSKMSVNKQLRKKAKEKEAKAKAKAEAGK